MGFREEKDRLTEKVSFEAFAEERMGEMIQKWSLV